MLLRTTPVAGIFNCDFSWSRTAFDKISTDSFAFATTEPVPLVLCNAVFTINSLGVSSADAWAVGDSRRRRR